MTEQAPPLISIVLPVKNGAPWLRSTLPAMLHQTLATQTEIIVIDSGSTDETLSILAGFPVQLIQVAPSSFNHGGTRMLGVRNAKGKYVVMTVQDATPADEYWLQHLLDGFEDDTVAGVCGQQVVPHHTDKNPADWFRPIDKPGIRKYQFTNPADFEGLPAAEKKHICSWDDVNAMYRRDILLSLPFQQVDFSEDMLWARDAIRKGYKIVYTGFAQVFHYHAETPDFTYRRSFTVFYHMYFFFGIKPALYNNGLLQLLRNIKLLLMETAVSWPAKWRWLLYNYRQRQAANRAVTDFNRTLENGEAALTAAHRIVCERPPQAPGTTS